MKKGSTKTYRDLTGKSFGLLTVLSVDYDSVKSNIPRKYKCLCKCGKESIVKGQLLVRGATKSCGCLRQTKATSKDNVKKLNSYRTRAGNRKCKRCKLTFYRNKNETHELCEVCRNKCARCGVEFDDSNRGSGKGHYKRCCKKCNTLHSKQSKWQAGDWRREFDLLRFYGITLIEYHKILDLQDGKCYICNIAPSNNKLSVDHQHQLGEKNIPPEEKRPMVRGLLCWRCNGGLGKFKDDPGLLDRAAQYLRSPPARGILCHSIQENDKNE